MKNTGNNSNDSNNGVPNKKERHVVSWSQEEDDILREQIRLHGTENWAIIASKFKDKTTRQCRRRWFSYLNSDFKKGGWSHEEDMLLCEAQRLFGNRWTEIAKVVSGRTDNAVKNRFTTLCKKRAKQEALPKENNDASYIDLCSKREVIFPNGINVDEGLENDPPLKKTRTCINQEDKIPGDFGVADHLRRNPFAVLAQNVHGFDANFPDQFHVCKETTAVNKSEDVQTEEGTFLKKDDPKVIALMQQAELLNSLAMKAMNSEKTMEPDMHELSSPSSSDYSTGSTVLAPCYEPEEAQTRIGVIKQVDITENQAGFSSPLQVTPIFRALAAAIPSPKFSESEKNFLMKTLGMESPSLAPRTDPSRPPPCKRSLLHCL